MANVYALQGRCSSGKTSTIREVFNQLKQKYPAAIINIILQKTDIKVIMDIGRIKVGIESQGDPNSRLKQSLCDFVQLNCDVIFCAVRTSGMTVDWVNQHASTHGIHYIQQNLVQNNYAATNANTAQSLIQTAGL